MPGWITSAAAVFGVVAAIAVGAAALGTRAWNRATEHAIRGLPRTAPPAPSALSLEQHEGLPAPVARYFTWALTPGGRRVRSARIEHRGTFRTGGPESSWSPFLSEQWYTVDPPGFVWDASIRMAPFLSVRVRDSYIGGRGAMLGKLAGILRVVDQKGTPELASGALHRWLAEACWFPTALLPGPALRWEAVDDSTARATLADAGNTVMMDFHFGASGEVARVTADRYRDVDGAGVLTPWVGEFRDYSEVDGMRIPMEAEVAWLLPEGRLSYWRGRIERIAYDSEG